MTHSLPYSIYTPHPNSLFPFIDRFLFLSCLFFLMKNIDITHQHHLPTNFNSNHLSGGNVTHVNAIATQVPMSPP